ARARDEICREPETQPIDSSPDEKGAHLSLPRKMRLNFLLIVRGEKVRLTASAVNPEKHDLRSGEPSYSCRRAAAGSMRAARSAGQKQACRPTIKSTATTKLNERGSKGDTIQICWRSNCVVAKLPTSPTAAPMTSSLAPRFRIIAMTLRKSAPRAMRTPISRVCSETRCDISPYTP